MRILRDQVIFFLNLVKGKQNMLFPSAIGIIYNRDVSAVVIKSLTHHEAVGQRYLITLGNLYSQLYLTRIVDECFPEFNLPDKLKDDLHIDDIVHTTDNSKTLEMLGRPFISLREVIIDSVQSYRDFGAFHKNK